MFPNEWNTTFTSTPRRLPQLDVILSMAGFWTLSTQIVSFAAFALACAAGAERLPTSDSATARTTASRTAKRLRTFIESSSSSVGLAGAGRQLL